MEMRFQKFMTKDINHWLKKQTIELLRIEQAELERLRQTEFQKI